jgi:hypothetical protein
MIDTVDNSPNITKKKLPHHTSPWKVAGGRVSMGQVLNAAAACTSVKLVMDGGTTGAPRRKEKHGWRVCSEIMAVDYHIRAVRWVDLEQRTG